MNQLSYVNGASSTPLIGATVGQYFDDACARYADYEALVVQHQQARLSYRELHERVNTLACGLRRLGLVPGDRIGIWSTNCVEWTLMQFATAKAGLILVNINPSYRRTELEYAINKVTCRAIVMASAFKDSNYNDMICDIAPELAHSEPGQLRAERLPSLEFVISINDEPRPGMMKFSALMTPPSAEDLAELAEVGEGLQFDDPINIQFTSGTTGSPKGATLSHHNILNNGFFCGEGIKLQEQDRVSIPVPLYHCFGMVIGNLACITHGATMVYPAAVFDAVQTLKAIETEKCTATYGVPTMFIAMLDHPDFGQYDLSSLRTGVMAGSPCPVEVMRQVMDKMHMSEVTICYGMTETSPVSFQSATDDPIDKRVSTVGRAHPHCEIKIVDELGKVVPRGVVGELCTRSYSVMLGYWGDEKKTAEAIDAAGWMHTEDLAVLDDEGYCQMVGRMKDLVIRGGENLYPREIEEFLYTHPDILDVQVIGVPDSKYGEELCAWIVVKEGRSLDVQDIRDFCNGQISRQKVPRYVKFVAEFPMTVTGKIKKFEMREIMQAELED
ncbi:MAG: AMP-binding protein [Neisseriaceae bacterium]|nr:AMP-binding protein [Neisseriaceae bacterium]MBP6861435.1 AMP-binding protein [Neisseriaceae bacterium]